MQSENISKAAVLNNLTLSRAEAEATSVAPATIQPNSVLFAEPIRAQLASSQLSNLAEFQTRPLPFALPQESFAVNGDANEDKLLSLNDSLQQQMDDLINGIGDKQLTQQELAKLQQQLNSIMLMMQMVSNILKKMDDTKSAIVQNIT